MTVHAKKATWPVSYYAYVWRGQLHCLTGGDCSSVQGWLTITILLLIWFRTGQHITCIPSNYTDWDISTRVGDGLTMKSNVAVYWQTHVLQHETSMSCGAVTERGGERGGSWEVSEAKYIVVTNVNFKFSLYLDLNTRGSPSNWAATF